MIPIFEQGNGKGIGHLLDTFTKRFDQICAQHLKDRRAKAFAFVFYDFNDRHIKTILRDQGVFTQLDRLAGKELSIFFLHTGTRHAVRQFNETFLKQLGLEEAKPPCVVFFKLSEGKAIDVSLASLESTDLFHGFKELHDVIASYLNTSNAEPKHVRWTKAAGKIIALETIKEGVKLSLGF
ncbi:MAG: hypothetical protein JSR72_06290 [Proteobacteria bacterium]|nr:hypothetical protein [Pseudomonadota bacterium]